MRLHKLLELSEFSAELRHPGPDHHVHGHGEEGVHGPHYGGGGGADVMVHRGDHIELLVRSVNFTDLLEAGYCGEKVFVSVFERVVFLHDQLVVD